MIKLEITIDMRSRVLTINSTALGYKEAAANEKAVALILDRALEIASQFILSHAQNGTVIQEKHQVDGLIDKAMRVAEVERLLNDINRC